MDVREVSIGLLVSVAGVDMDTVAKQPLFTVPVGKRCVVTHVVVRDRSGALGADYDFGHEAQATGWIQAVDLSSIGANEYLVVQDEPDGGAYGHYAVITAGVIFGVKPIAGTAQTATIDIFGYLYDA